MGLHGLILFVLQAIVSPHAFSVSAQPRAQSVVWIEAGAIDVRQRSQDAVLASALSLSGRRATSQLALSGSVWVVQTGEKNSGAVEGTLGAEYLLPRLESARIEVSASSTRYGAFSSEHGTSRSGFVRPQFVHGRVGAFSTLGAGTISRDSLNFHALDWDIGGWFRPGPVSGLVTVRHAFTNDFPLVENMGFLLTDAEARHYAVRDVEGTLSARFGRLDVQMTGTMRNGIESTTGHVGAVSVAALMRLNSRFGLSVTAGEQVADFRSGVPSARLLGASLRFNLFKPSSATALAPRVQNSSPFSTAVERHATGGATVRIRVDAPADARVEVSGSFNEWSVLPVSRVGNVFEHVLELPSGTHRIAIRINGGTWKAPAGLTRVKDDLGGDAGLVVVP